MEAIYKPSGRAAEYAHLALNHYIGCDHRCVYCYAPAALRVTREAFHNKVEPRKDILARVRTDAAMLSGTDQRVLLSFACEPYPQIDSRLGLTREILKVFVHNDVPFTVLTKAGELAFRDFAMYRAGLDAFAVTLTTIDDATAAEIEPGAAPPSERMAMLETAHDRGIETWVSLEPVIEPMESLKIITATHKYVDLYKIGKLNHQKSTVTADEWCGFARRAVNLCVATGSAYYLKSSLAVYHGDLPLGNTDNRCAIRECVGMGDKRGCTL